MTNPTRCSQVNKALRAAGHQEELVRDPSGYFYFSGGDAPTWHCSSVMVYSITGLSLEEWLAEHADLKSRGH